MEKTFCCLCCASGPLTLTAALPITGFVPGQTIACSIEVENASNVDITQVKFRLSKKVVFKASNTVSTKENKVDIAESNLGPVNANSNKNWSEQLVIPSLPPSNLVGCSIIDLSYTVKVEAIPSGVHRTLQVRIPISIGTVPLLGTVPPQQVPAATDTNNQPSAPLPETPNPSAGWNLPTQPTDPNSPSLYPNLVPASFDESQFSSKDIKDSNDTKYTQGNLSFAPRYPVYNFAPQN